MFVISLLMKHHADLKMLSVKKYDLVRNCAAGQI